jgi:membrane protease YdiL (CAAX protease family)
MMNNATAPPELSLFSVLFGLAFLAFLGASLGGWIWFTLNLKIVRSWVGWERDEPASRVGLVDLILFFCCIVVTQIPLVVAVRPFISRDAKPTPEVSIASEKLETATAPAGTKTEDVPAWVTPLLALSYMMAWGLSVFLLCFRTRSSLLQLGILGGDFTINIALGFAAFLLATPVILILSGIVNSITDIQYEHPVIEAMKQHPWMFPFLFFGAVICAPIWEEYAFRGLLIRWLDSVRSSGGNLKTVFLGQTASAVALSDSPDQPGLSYASASGNPYEPPFASRTQATVPAPSSLLGNDSTYASANVQTGEATPAIGETFPPWWPAVVSGIVFGLAHFSYGISWVPLVLFGLISARLFQLRRSIVPCIVLHACFNALSMFGLAARVFTGE